MLNAPLRIMIVAGVCVLALIGLVVRESYERSAPTSRNVDMLMQAVDPRTLLSGHYVIVSLQDTILTHDGSDPCANFPALQDNRSWLALVYTGPEFRVPPPEGTALPWAPIGAASSRGAAQGMARAVYSNGVAARGSVTCSEMPQESPGSNRYAVVQTQLRGIERFYAPQAEAERIDALMRGEPGEQRVYAIINVSADGQARLVGLKVNGEIIELSWL